MDFVNVNIKGRWSAMILGMGESSLAPYPYNDEANG